MCEHGGGNVRLANYIIQCAGRLPRERPPGVTCVNNNSWAVVVAWHTWIAELQGQKLRACWICQVRVAKLGAFTSCGLPTGRRMISAKVTPS